MPKKILRLFGGFALLTALGSRSAPIEGPYPNDDVKKRISAGYSVSPIVGYDPVYGVLVGGAIFRGKVDSPYSNASAIVYGSFKPNLAVEFHYKRWERERTFVNVDSQFSNFFSAYFGEGGRTDPNSRIDIRNFKGNIDPSFGYRFNPQLTLLGYSSLRYRTELGVEGNLGRSVFGSEFRPALGISANYDNRDNQIDTHNGFYFSLALDMGPAILSTKSDAATFARAETDLRGFTQALDWLVVAMQIKAGAIAGDAGYQFRFTLGGSDTLRGYTDNRFRGNFYYLSVLETRFSLLRWLSLATFVSTGDAADKNPSDFHGPLFTKGFGLRIGLPPDFVAKGRLDFGFADDQQSVYLSFNEAF